MEQIAYLTQALLQMTKRYPVCTPTPVTPGQAGRAASVYIDW